MAANGDGKYDLVVVSNRLPVDRVVEGANGGTATGPIAVGAAGADGQWRRSPGGLVAALEPVMRSTRGAWVGWAGQPDLDLDPFDLDGLHLIPVSLCQEDIELYYEGFSNGTLWPLYHDVISAPVYHREWWDAYVEVNQRFADAAAAAASEGGFVWVHDYQLQLVPQMLRAVRPDLVIGFFNHIPFPPYGIFSQLPWRNQIVAGLLGADVVGFQRGQDASNFMQAVRRRTGFVTKAPYIEVPADDGPARRVLARSFPISIDAAGYEELAKDPAIIARAAEIRAGLGDPRVVMLGVDRLDYTKGIAHRLKAFGELLAERRIEVGDVCLVQVASPSRERVQAYIQLRDEIEQTVGRINGDFGTISASPVSYLHHAFPREEMVALYLAADILLVTALRDGMNLVAKEYVATRTDEGGVLVLSEFAGASDELRQAVLVNPHDIDGLKDALVRAIEMPAAERRKRMRSMRRRVIGHNVAYWSTQFLGSLEQVRERRRDGDGDGGGEAGDAAPGGEGDGAGADQGETGRDDD